jgi:hypothetical protein
MLAHIDQFRRALRACERGFYNAFRRRDKGDYRTIVIGIDVPTEHAGGLDCANRVLDLLDRLGFTALAEVRHTFH